MSRWLSIDARGQQSRTLFFVTVSWLVLILKYAVAGVTLGPLGTMLPMTALEFGGAFALILAPWLGREWTEKRP